MTAHDQIRKMLDELMGTGRDGTVRQDQVHFTDNRACRSFLLGCCPHEVLQNTRMDMGDCPKIHDPALRADFEKAQKDKDFFYDLDALEHLERFFDDCDRKTELAKKRLAETQEELSTEVSDKATKVLELNETIGKTLAEAEQLGEEGKVDESLKLMEKVEEIRKQKQDAEQEYRNSMPASSYQQQKLRVCEVCSAYLGIHDNDRRLADHFGGKLHMGFVFLREKLADLRAKAPDRRTVRDRERYGSRYDRYGAGGPPDHRDRYRRGGGGGGGSRNDDFDRNKRRSTRSRSRSRERSKGSGSGSKRSRSKERDDRSSDRHDKKSKRRSKDRERSKEAEGSNRSGSASKSTAKPVRLSDVDD